MLKNMVLLQNGFVRKLKIKFIAFYIFFRRGIAVDTIAIEIAQNTQNINIIITVSLKFEFELDLAFLFVSLVPISCSLYN